MTAGEPRPETATVPPVTAVGEKSLIDHVLVPIDRAGWPFIAAGLCGAVVLYLLWAPLGWVGLAAAAFCVFFFRDPPRVTPIGPGLIVSPADGLVAAVEHAVPPEDLGMGEQPRVRVSVFLSVFDVHINRVPADGTITAVAYRKGKFLNAANDKASEDNERQAVRLTTADGRDIAFVQIAGLIARRIRCTLSDGQSVRAGERYGLIRFGSRADIYLPDGVVPLVAPGQRMIGGETVIADLTSEQEPRLGEAR